MACPPPADAVERAYVAALGRVAAWRSDNGELALLDAGAAEVLRYRAATPVGSWSATAFLQGDGFTSPIVGTHITASFRDDGTLSGSAGCNTYKATFTTQRGAIEITAPAATRKACARRDHGAGGGVSRRAARGGGYRVGGGTLELMKADGTLIAHYTRDPTP